MWNLVVALTLTDVGVLAGAVVTVGTFLLAAAKFLLGGEREGGVLDNIEQAVAIQHQRAVAAEASEEKMRVRLEACQQETERLTQRLREPRR